MAVPQAMAIVAAAGLVMTATSGGMVTATEATTEQQQYHHMMMRSSNAMSPIHHSKPRSSTKYPAQHSQCHDPNNTLPSVAELVCTHPQLTHFCRSAAELGLWHDYEEGSSYESSTGDEMYWTIFAPTNEAFEDTMHDLHGVTSTTSSSSSSTSSSSALSSSSSSSGFESWLKDDPQSALDLIQYHVHLDAYSPLDRHDMVCDAPLQMSNDQYSLTLCGAPEPSNDNSSHTDPDEHTQPPPLPLLYQAGTGNGETTAPRLLSDNDVSSHDDKNNQHEPPLFACDGIVHVMDNVMLQGCGQSIADVLCADPTFGITCQALRATHLDLGLSFPGPFTIFAPDDDAWQSIGIMEHDIIDAHDVDDADYLHDIAEILLTHIVSGQSINEVKCTSDDDISMSNGVWTYTKCRKGKVYQTVRDTNRSRANRVSSSKKNDNKNKKREASIVNTRSPIEACNGLIWAMDGVMLPPVFLHDESEMDEGVVPVPNSTTEPYL